MTFILGYEFPKNNCSVRLYWQAQPFLWLPHGAEIVMPNPDDIVPSGTPTPYLGFELFIIEDPNGFYQINAIPDSIRIGNIVANTRYAETFANSMHPFRDKYEGSFVVNPQVTSRIYIGVGVALHAPLTEDRVCIGCNLSGNEKNNLLESALFSVSSWSAGSGGPSWHTKSISE